MAKEVSQQRKRRQWQSPNTNYSCASYCPAEYHFTTHEKIGDFTMKFAIKVLSFSFSFALFRLLHIVKVKFHPKRFLTKFLSKIQNIALREIFALLIFQAQESYLSPSHLLLIYLALNVLTMLIFTIPIIFGALLSELRQWAIWPLILTNKMKLNYI